MDKIFDGDVDVYLWGNNALTDGKKTDSDLYTEFFVGGCSDIVLVDIRNINWQDAHTFCVPSHLEVLADFDENNVKTMKLVLTPNKGNEITKTLILGVSEDSTIPAYDVEWELYRNCPFGGVTVVTLIND